MRRLLPLLLLLAVSVTVALECRTGWFRYKDSCYKFERQEKANFRKAADRCNDIESTLFVANSKDEFKYIMEQQAPLNTWTWLGLDKHEEDKEGRWHGGSGMNYKELPWLVTSYGNGVNGWNSVSKCAAHWNPSSELGKYIYWYPCNYDFYFVCERNSSLPF